MRRGLGADVFAGGNPCFDERTGTYTCGPNAPTPPPVQTAASVPGWVKWAAVGLVVLVLIGGE